jgi:nucleoid DNA-binding protein
MSRPHKTIDELYPLVVSLTGLPKYKVEKVVKHQFKELNRFLNFPHKTSMYLSGLGTFRMELGHNRRAILRLIEKIRESRKNKDTKKEQLYTEQFKLWWSHREELKKKYMKK